MGKSSQVPPGPGEMGKAQTGRSVCETKFDEIKSSR